MPIVSRTLATGQSETWFLTGSGFCIVAASGSLSHIEFLRNGKTVEDLVGSFGEGFFFETPNGSVFDGVRIFAETSGSFSLFIGHGKAGIIETDNSKPVTVTNSEIAVDVQNAILNTEIVNSAVDVDIAAQTVSLTTEVFGYAANTPGPTIITGGTNYDTVTASLTLASGNVAEIAARASFYSNAYPTCPSTDVIVEILRGSTVIFSEAINLSTICVSSSNAYFWNKVIYDTFVGSNTYTLRIRRVASGSNHPVTINANIKATK